MKQGDVVAVYCGTCGAATAHDAVAHFSREVTETTSHGVHLDYSYGYNLLLCTVCGTAQLYTTEWLAQLETGSAAYYPPHPVRAWPSWADTLPSVMAECLKETHLALAQGHFWLAAMGSRALIDMFVFERIGDIGTFAAKLKQLVAECYISEQDRLMLDAAFSVGSAAMHRGHRPCQGSCNAALEIAENLLHRLSLGILVDQINAQPAFQKPVRQKATKANANGSASAE